MEKHEQVPLPAPVGVGQPGYQPQAPMSMTAGATMPRKTDAAVSRSFHSRKTGLELQTGPSRL